MSEVQLLTLAGIRVRKLGKLLNVCMLQVHIVCKCQGYCLSPGKLTMKLAFLATKQCASSNFQTINTCVIWPNPLYPLALTL